MAGLVLENPLKLLPALDSTLVDVQRKVVAEETGRQIEGGGGGTWVSGQCRLILSISTLC